MNGVDSIDEHLVSRRTILEMISIAGIPILAGCNVDSNKTDDEPASAEPADSRTNELEEIRTSLSGIYRVINRFPVSEEGEFIFDVQNFEANFDHEELLEETSKIQNQIKEADPVSRVERDELRSITTIAELLIRERILTHQSIVAGLTYESGLMQGEYASATDTIEQGNEYLKKLSATRREIEDKLGEVSEDTISIDGFESGSIQASQSVLLEIILWTRLIYQSFEYASVGFKLFEDGAEKISEERVDEAREIFANSGDQFKRANELLEQAHGRGRRLDYVVPLVRKLRCVLPVYRDSCDRLVHSFTAWQSGDESKARRIGRKLIVNVDQGMSRCEDSETV